MKVSVRTKIVSFDTEFYDEFNSIIFRLNSDKMVNLDAKYFLQKSKKKYLGVKYHFLIESMIRKTLSFDSELKFASNSTQIKAKSGDETSPDANYSKLILTLTM